MKKLLLSLIILVVALAPAAKASEKQVRIEDTVLKTITQQNGSAVFTLKSNWLTYRTNQKPELVKAGEAITLMANSEITIVEKHSKISITYKPGIGIVLQTTHDARSVGGSIQTSIEVLEIK